jgi:hypothetical protein
MKINNTDEIRFDTNLQGHEKWVSVNNLKEYIDNLIKSNDMFRYEAIDLFEDLVDEIEKANIKGKDE